MGRTSYAENDVKWEQEGYYSSDSNVSKSLGSCTTLDNLPRRTQRWMLGRCKRDKNGNLILANEKTRKVAEKIEHMKQKVKKGEFVPHRTDDELNRAPDRKEHGGRVLGYGAGAKHKKVFGPCRWSSRSQAAKEEEIYGKLY
ncbi:hypothetical protein M5689_003260 [Euphorbia peplus]|nr:hypothetical protein M5689_003260 [Euphorbia peplus]